MFRKAWVVIQDVESWHFYAEGWMRWHQSIPKPVHKALVSAKGTAEVGSPSLFRYMKKGTKRIYSVLFQPGAWENLIVFWEGRLSGENIPNIPLSNCAMCLPESPKTVHVVGCAHCEYAEIDTHCMNFDNYFMIWKAISYRSRITASSIHWKTQWGSKNKTALLLISLCLRKENVWLVRRYSR